MPPDGARNTAFTGMKATNSPHTTQTVSSRRGQISLRVKFLLTLAGLTLLPFLFMVMHITTGYDSLLQHALSGISDDTTRASIQYDEDQLTNSIALLALVFLVLISAGVMASERFFTGEIRTLLAWLRDARSKNYKQLAAAPLTSSDELAELGLEMKEGIWYFQEIEERERKVVEQKSEFISVAAHQLRTPLTGLRWGIETIVSDKTSPELRTKTGGNIYSTIEQMISLVDSLLDVAKLEEGKFDFHFEQVDLVPLVRKMFDHFTLIAQSRSIAINLKSSESVQVYADPARIEIALSNLVSNALNYTHEGGSIDVSITDAGERVEISIADTGIGIPADHLPKLFEKFSRADNAARMRPDGSGLGLYIVNNIVEKHGGHIAVESVLGKGTTMRFSIAKKEEAAKVAKESMNSFFKSF